MSAAGTAPNTSGGERERLVGRWGEAVLAADAPPGAARAVLAALGGPIAGPPGVCGSTDALLPALAASSATAATAAASTANEPAWPEEAEGPDPAETGVWVDPDDLPVDADARDAEAIASRQEPPPAAFSGAVPDLPPAGSAPRYSDPEPGSGRRRRRLPPRTGGAVAASPDSPDDDDPAARALAMPTEALDACAEAAGSPVSTATADLDQEVAPIPMIAAAICTAGHANPPDARTCQCCPAPLSGRLAPVPRPVLAVLVLSTGLSVPVRGDVVVGRAPRAQPGGEPAAVLLEVPSPTRLISRSHLLVTTAGWNVLARDLGSYNGTVLLRPGLPAVLLATALPTPLYMGDLLDVGDGVALRVEPPV